jgi:rare lipoprotein A
VRSWTAPPPPLPIARFRWRLTQVTNLENSRSVIVKINDRGPYTPGRIIDLSSRAADALDMKRAGVAAVVIERLVYRAAPTFAAFQAPGAALVRQVSGASGKLASRNWTGEMAGTPEDGIELP